ncbi:hypothetical protein EPN52_04800 [bacterium]|nr:MAG: hypothetical protein EPN52_04800 [bacterium]
MKNSREPVLNAGFRGSHALAQRPQALAALGAIYVEWTRIEASLAVMLATLLFGESLSTGDEIAAMEIMEHCTGIAGKTQSLIAVARIRLSENPALLKRFQKSLDAIVDAARTRNRLVHGRWSIGPEPDTVRHERRIGLNSKNTTYNPSTLACILNNLERVYDELHAIFFEEVVPASEDFLSRRIDYFSAIQDR